MSNTTRKVVLLASHPHGTPKMSDYKVVEQELKPLEEGYVRVAPTYFSVDPYLRGKMSGRTGSYFVPFQVDGPVQSVGVGKVVESTLEQFKVGDLVSGEVDWATVSDVKPSAFFSKLQEGVTPQLALSLFGITGLTAYLGLLEIGKLEEKPAGSTVLVTGAAGATGNVVGQIAKLKGYRVVGVAGSEEKIRWLKDDLKFDEVINYRTENIKEALAAKCPKGIDVYFDNVGGEIFDAAIEKMNQFGVIVGCGAISTYNATEVLKGPRVEWLIITKSLRWQGFIVSNLFQKFGEAIKDMSTWIKEGKLQARVTEFDGTSDGVTSIPDTFIKMMSGSNVGKAIVKIQ